MLAVTFPFAHSAFQRPLNVKMPSLSFSSDNGPGTRATLGVVVLKTDETMEGDLRAFIPSDGVALYHTRIPFEPQVTAETLARMENDLSASVDMFPAAAPFNVIGYGCTSGSAVIGEDRIAARIQSVFPKAAATNPLSATKAALSALNAKRVALVSPYVEEVSQALRDRLSEAGFEPAAVASFDQIEDAAVARITPQSIHDAIVSTANIETVDAVFVSCTSLRTADVIVNAEETIGIPVVSSNQALAWHMMRLAGIQDASAAMGLLGKC